jgi:hypothetical protein
MEQHIPESMSEKQKKEKEWKMKKEVLNARLFEWDVHQKKFQVAATRVALAFLRREHTDGHAIQEKGRGSHVPNFEQSVCPHPIDQRDDAESSFARDAPVASTHFCEVVCS